MARGRVMRAYRHLPSLEEEHDDLSVRCIQDSDIEGIRQWRNAQMEVLRQTAPITRDQQLRYYESAIWPQMAREFPDTILITIMRDGRPIGYGGLVHCAWTNKRAEVSVLFAPDISACDRDYRACLMGFLAMVQRLAFDSLGLNRLTLETYAIRRVHIGILEEAGFLREGRLRDHVRIGGHWVDSLIHARNFQDYRFSAARGGRTSSRATRSILVPSIGGS